jgi:acetyl-CoA synthetase
VIVYKRTGGNIAFQEGRDMWLHELVEGQPAECEPEWVDAEHPLFILYTSGSTGTPKGVQHSTGGYLLWAALTMKWTFDIKPDDVYWCTADIGWVTGHSYIATARLAVGATQIVFEGVPTFPNAGRFWETIAKHKVSDLLHRADRDPFADQGVGRDEKVHPKNYDLSSACACWARSASRSIRKPGCGTTRTSAASAARSSTPSGRPKPAAT